MKPLISVNYFLEKLIDYAGLFPPAKLEIKPSLENYANYIQSKDKWMMSKFIIPTSRLNDIPDDVIRKYSDQHPLRLSLISKNICNDIDTVKEFLQTNYNSTIFSACESPVSDLSAFSKDILDVYKLVENHDLSFELFYELVSNDNWTNKINEAVSIISAFNAEHETNIGFKLRCGGVESHMFPDAENIGKAIIACRDANVSMKFTAGLHHPIRHYSKAVKTKMYGFFNIFVGGMIAHKFNLENGELTKILLDENPKNFIFDIDGLHWKAYSISNAEVQHYRKKSFISYGSCSFNEPIEDLKKLGLL